MEIERKFYITNREKVNELIHEYNQSKKTIIQDYIYSDIFTAIRKRKIVNQDTIKYVYTIKTGRKGYSVNEIENEITEEQYNSINKDLNRRTIEKDRYCIPYENNLVIELDVFHGDYEGVVFAEIEFETEEQAVNAKLPNWFGTDISGMITNGMMSKKHIDIDEFIRNKMGE